MIILDEPFASDVLLDWCEASAHPVLDNAFVRAAAGTRALNLVGDAEAARRVMAGERLYTNSENALSWLDAHAPDAPATRTAALFKDKAGIREALAGLDPQVYFRRIPAAELHSIDPDGLPLPVVLKPTVGFCSMGVYVVRGRADWDAALDDIAENERVWASRYPGTVVGTGEFIVESLIEGQEYALDAFFDEEGRPHLLNILRHDFADAEDTSDRMYVTSPSIIQETSGLFLDWLSRVNEVVGARSFPVHVEVRVKDGHVSPIEFNPLRFAGLSGTDISWYAYGYRTYEAFLDDRLPDFDAVLPARRGKAYCMSLLGVPADCTGAEPFDLEALIVRFYVPLRVLELDGAATGSYAFLFLETDESDPAERDWLLRADLHEFIG